MHIALIGLTGDPPHLGHLEVARTVHNLGYARVWFLITPRNPVKHAAPVPYLHRRELARLLTRGHEDWLEVSDFEAGVAVHHAELRTHTVLGQLKEIMPEATFTFVMGADNWADATNGFHTWQNFRAIAELAGLLILPRAPYTARVSTCPAAQALAGQQREGTKPILPGSWGLGPEINHPASSTAVRQALTTGADTPYLTEPQKSYIRHHGLYR